MRHRSGSTGANEKKDPKDVFQDLAVQSKKGFNAIMQKLGGDRDKDRDSDGFVMVSGGKDEDSMGLGVQRRGTATRGQGKGGETSALRGVRLKREADDAGEYSSRSRSLLVGEVMCSVYSSAMGLTLTLVKTSYIAQASSTLNR